LMGRTSVPFRLLQIGTWPHMQAEQGPCYYRGSQRGTSPFRAHQEPGPR